MTAEQQVPTPSTLGPLARYEQSVMDRITDFSAAQGDRALMGAPSVRRAAARQAEPVAQLRFVA